jgi:hypothetical protein
LGKERRECGGSSEHDVTKCRGIHISRRVRGVSALIRWVRNRVWVGQCLTAVINSYNRLHRARRKRRPFKPFWGGRKQGEGVPAQQQILAIGTIHEIKKGRGMAQGAWARDNVSLARQPRDGRKQARECTEGEGWEATGRTDRVQSEGSGNPPKHRQNTGLDSGLPTDVLPLSWPCCGPQVFPEDAKIRCEVRAIVGAKTRPGTSIPRGGRDGWSG